MLKNINTLKLFFEYPTKEYNVREVARLVKISPPTSSKILTELTKRGLLKMKKNRMMKLYKSNLESDMYRDAKIYYNIRMIKESGLLNYLNSYYLKPTIILFGSASKGIDTETSDFDILVVSEKNELPPNLKQFEKKVKRKIQILTARKLKAIKNKHLLNNILNGIVIQGKIKWT